MILPTMDENEKAFEAYRIHEIAYETYLHYFDEVLARFRKGTRFPYFNRIVWTDDKMNKWWLVYECPSKKFARKGLVRTFCYTVYTIDKKKKDDNCGKGVILFDPYTLHLSVNKEIDIDAKIMDIVPHVFNRFTKRYLEPIGKADIEFERKVELLMNQWVYYDLLGDKSSVKHEDKGMCPYDVFFKNGGMMRGNIVNGMLLRFYTYVSKDLLYEEQKDYINDNMSEFWVGKRLGNNY